MLANIWWSVDACTESPHWGLNPGPSAYKTDVLLLSYRGRCRCRRRVAESTAAASAARTGWAHGRAECGETRGQGANPSTWACCAMAICADEASHAFAASKQPPIGQGASELGWLTMWATVAQHVRVTAVATRWTGWLRAACCPSARAPKTEGGGSCLVCGRAGAVSRDRLLGHLVISHLVRRAVASVSPSSFLNREGCGALHVAPA